MNKLVPNLYQKDIYTINYKKLKKIGIRCLLFDLDNTCVPYHDITFSKKLKELFNKLKKMGYIVIIFSNSPNKRLKKFANLDVDYNAMSLKPLSYNFRKVMKKYHVEKEEVCIIGDQLFTDIYGGNKVGIYTCLVEPLTNKELTFTKITRYFEKRKIKKLEKEGKFKRGNYYD